MRFYLLRLKSVALNPYTDLVVYQKGLKVQP
jgi:hypothetical protein